MKNHNISNLEGKINFNPQKFNFTSLPTISKINLRFIHSHP